MILFTAPLGARAQISVRSEPLLGPSGIPSVMQDLGAQQFSVFGDGFVRLAKGGAPPPPPPPACTPTTCAAQGKNCGTIPNGCGGTLTCGACTAPQTCGGAGVANVCG